MGIPRFFKWLTKKGYYSDIAKDCVENEPNTIDERQPNPNGIEFHNLYLDMNGLIRSSISASNDWKLKKEDEVIQSILDSIDRIFAIVRPCQLLYIAIDGVAPRAKLNQQRSRRAVKLYITEEIKKKRDEILSKGKYLPDASNEEANESSNELCFKPGTAFMLRLSEYLRYYIYQRMNRKPAWKSIKVILSDANVPGEGEHKIINFIRQQRTLSTHHHETHHVILSPDADSILLGIATHEQHVTIMRDKQKPITCVLCHQYGHSFETCEGIEKEVASQSSDSKPNSNETTYIFLYLSKLCDKLFHEQMKVSSNFKWDRKRFLDDWVFICLMMGNDFLPDIPLFEIDDKIIDILLEIYSRHVRKLNEYLTENGELQMNVFKNIAMEFEEIENMKVNIQPKLTEQLLANHRISKPQTTSSFNKADIVAQKETTPVSYRPPSFSRTTNAATVKSTETASSLHENSGFDSSSSVASNSQQSNQTIPKSSDSSTLNHSKGDWRERYYQAKFSAHEPRGKVVQEYIRGLQWVLQYYYCGVPSWDWYYPYYYAPLASDFGKLSHGDELAQFNKESQPLKPLEQLICILPTQYTKYLPASWQRLVEERDLPIMDLHPSQPPIDTNGKRYKSQYTAILPFVKEEHLNQIRNYQYPSLTAEESDRNEIHDDLLFIHQRNQHYSLLEEELNADAAPGGTAENLTQLLINIKMPGRIWKDDQANTIGQPIEAPSPKYTTILDNQVLSVKYACRTD